MKIYLSSDHAGFELKQKLIPFLQVMGHQTEDLGPYEQNDSDDYPDFVIPLAKEIQQNPETRGIILGGSGQGEAIAAGRFKGIRTLVFNSQALPHDGINPPDEVITSREHNDSNVLSLGARFITEAEAKEAIKKWLETPFSQAERHIRRIQKLEQYGS